MRFRFALRGTWTSVLAGAGLLTLVALPARAQNSCVVPPPACPALIPLPAPAPGPATVPGLTPAPGTTAPGQAPAPATTAAPAEAQPPSTDLSLNQRFAGLGGETVARGDVGYIDSAIPVNRLRIRYDAADNDNRPDRAEFFYAKCGCFALAGIDPHAPGPFQQPRKVDFQEQSTYLEGAYDNRLSAFVEIPVRFVDFDDRVDTLTTLHSNQAGLADINFGAKYAVIADKDRYLTGQLRTFAPSGDAREGLGTNHWSLEPALLFYQRLSDRLVLEGEFRDWIPIDGTDFAGNVLRYGVGLGYDIYQNSSLRVTPVVEFVGWTVLSGKELDVNTGATLSARGDTIVNVKGGVRTFFGQHSDVYVGYGRALTGDVWYKDIVRVEYRLTF